jgi:hypothetical protein
LPLGYEATVAVMSVGFVADSDACSLLEEGAMNQPMIRRKKQMNAAITMIVLLAMPYHIRRDWRED